MTHDPTPNRPAPRNTAYHGPAVVRMHEVQPSSVRWLWEQRLALGKLTLIAGDPGLGKSYLTLDLASRVSTGAAMPGDNWPDGTPMDRYPGVAILLSAEDDPADTIRPRLEAAGANLERVALVRGVRTGEHVRSFNLKEDLRFLRGMCQHEDEVRLIIIDPISAYLGDDEGHSNTKVRNLLAPLAKLAQDFNVAVVAVTHLNKGGGGSPGSAIYRTMGSLAFTAAARTVHLVARDPDDPERRLLLPVKNNLGQDRTGYGFALGSEPNAPDVHVVWDATPTEESADELLARLGRQQAGGPNPTERDLAKRWLADALDVTPRSTIDIERQAQVDGISKATLRRARKEMGIRAYRTAQGWYLTLPGRAVEDEWSPDDPEAAFLPGLRTGADLEAGRGVQPDAGPGDRAGGGGEARGASCDADGNGLADDRDGRGEPAGGWGGRPYTLLAGEALGDPQLEPQPGG